MYVRAGTWYGLLYLAPARPLRPRLHGLSAHPDGVDVVPQLVDDRAAEKWIGIGNFVSAWNDHQFWVSLGFTLEIHALHHPDPDGRRLPDRAPRRAQHAAPQAHPRHRVRAGGDRARRLEPALVLAVQLQFRPGQSRSRRPRRGCQAGALVRRGRQPRALGGDRLDRLEGARLRHAALRRRDPGDPRRGGGSGDGRRRQLLAARAQDHPAADPRGRSCSSRWSASSARCWPSTSSS